MLYGLSLPPGLTVGTFAAVAFTNTISTGFIVLGILTSLGTIVCLIYGVRWKTAYQVERATRESIDERARVLAHERDDVTEKLAEATRALLVAQKTIARLEPLNDMARVLELVTKSFERLVDRQEEMHRENKEDTARVLKAIDGRAA